ncbi:MAG: GNAT family N-acetyltransferase [Reyranella sp.]|nr:GNAT family N-acetyltransferase [Reyranella sp.]
MTAVNVNLRTERLVLRRPVLADATALHVIFSDPLAMRYWSSLPHRTLDQTEAWIAGTLQSAAEGVGDDFVIEHQGQVIGKCGLWRDAELGFLLAPAAWGQGYAREAVAAVLARAFDTPGRLQVVAETDPRNARSAALLRRVGFRETGRAERTFCLGGEWSDSVYFALDKAAWRGGALTPA